MTQAQSGEGCCRFSQRVYLQRTIRRWLPQKAINPSKRLIFYDLCGQGDFTPCLNF
ncbi:hypothetical protein [Candidatus Chlorohelix sp.]|uniref:hypothetical protein n=1 Tax=Candidatus Chlorohelix sp. TaxID=3139201 RepID=UPI003035EE6D